MDVTLFSSSFSLSQSLSLSCSKLNAAAAESEGSEGSEAAKENKGKSHSSRYESVGNDRFAAVAKKYEHSALTCFALSTPSCARGADLFFWCARTG